MATKLKFDFYELIAPKGMLNPFAEVTRALSQVHRAVTIADSPYRVESFRAELGYIYGSASKVELRNLPLRIDPNQPGARPLDLEEEEGIGRPTSFLVAQRGAKLLLVFQYNHYGLRVGGFLDLLQILSGQGAFSHRPIIQPDKYQEVMNWGVYRTFTAKVSHPVSKEAFKTQTVAAVARSSGELEAPTVSISLSMGHEKGSMSWANVRAAVTEFLGLQSTDVKSLIVSGAMTADNRIEEVDLLAHRLTREVNAPGDLRTIEVEILEKAVQQAYLAAEDALNAHFGA